MLWGNDYYLKTRARLVALRGEGLQQSLFLNYGAAHFSKSLVGLSSVLIFAFFLTEIVGLSPHMMGIILGISLCFSALCDVGLGWVLREKIVSASSAAPIMLLGSILTAVSFTAFSAAGLVPQDFQLAFVSVTLLAYRFSYSLYDLPHNAMMAFITSSDSSRAGLSAARYVTAGLAKIIVAVLFGSWLMKGMGLDRAHIAFLGCTLFAVSGVIGAAMLYRNVALNPLKLTHPTGPSVSQSTNDVDTDAARSTDIFPIVLLSIAIFSSLMATFTKLQAYLAAFSLGSGFASVTFIILVALGQIISQFLWARLARSMPLYRLYQLTAFGLGIVSVLFISLAHYGGALLLAIAFFYGGVSSGLLMAIWSLQATAAKCDQGLASQRFGLFIFVSKLAQASSVLALGYLLEQFDFRNPLNSDILAAVMASGPIATAALCSIIGWLLSRQTKEVVGRSSFLRS